MVLPNFVGIGAQRAGSTWLHELLASHSGVYMPTRRKEVHYFDLYFRRGRGWYESFFREAKPGQVVGEVTPDYLHTLGCAERLAEGLPDAKLLVILREPAERAYSHYKKLVKDDNYRGTFEEVLEERPDIVERGLYAAQLGEFLRFFPRGQICLLLYEDAVTDVDRAKATLAGFLGLDPSGFGAAAGERAVHQSYVPKARTAYAVSKSVARKLHAADLDWLVNAAKRLRVPELFGQAAPASAMLPETRTALRERYREDASVLAARFGLDLAAWGMTP